MKDNLLELCKRAEEWIIMTYPQWKKEKIKFRKDSYYKFGIPNVIFYIPLSKKQFSSRISELSLNSICEEPTTYLSKDHDIRRNIVAEECYKNFNKYNFTGDGSVMKNLIENLTYSFVTKKENNAKYDDKKVNKIPISERELKGIKRYQNLAKRGWFKNRKITNPMDFKKIPRTINFKTEEEFFRWID